jgi:hypothetical protein
MDAVADMVDQPIREMREFIDTLFDQVATLPELAATLLEVRKILSTSR